MKSMFECKFGDCHNFPGFKCNRCGRMFCRQHFNHTKNLCLACAAPAEPIDWGNCAAWAVAIMVVLGVVIGIVVWVSHNNSSTSSTSTQTPWTYTVQTSDMQKKGSNWDNNRPDQLKDGDSFIFTVNAPKAGLYSVSINSATDYIVADPEPTATLTVIVNGAIAKTYPDVNNDFSNFTNVTMTVSLNEGNNTFELALKGDPARGLDINEVEVTQGITSSSFSLMLASNPALVSHNSSIAAYTSKHTNLQNIHG